MIHVPVAQDNLVLCIAAADTDSLYRSLDLSLIPEPIRPGIVRVRTRLRRPAARALLANSITLTPGTLAVDVREDGTMMVHWIVVRSTDPDEAARLVVGRFEGIIARFLDAPGEEARHA